MLPRAPSSSRASRDEVVLSSDAALSVRNEVDGATLRWFVAGAGGAKVPKGLEAFVRPAQGGVAVEIPLSAHPEVAWRPNELTVRWAADGEHIAAAVSGDPFTEGAAPSYPLGPGDKIQVTVYNVEDMNQTVTVDPGGNITFPVLDKVPVKGLSVNELQKKLEDLLAQFVKAPQVSIQLIEYGSRFVNVLGQVAHARPHPAQGRFQDPGRHQPGGRLPRGFGRRGAPAQGRLGPAPEPGSSPATSSSRARRTGATSTSWTRTSSTSRWSSRST